MTLSVNRKDAWVRPTETVMGAVAVADGARRLWNHKRECYALLEQRTEGSATDAASSKPVPALSTKAKMLIAAEIGLGFAAIFDGIFRK
ncbi:MAG TPA: hypothetical protein VLE96_05275 [Chlamydiales bacterium]|nr:hypothetical protein [Chlamydiales bacterium]